jgi:hypothetical protein
MVVGHWWNGSDWVKPKYFDESLSKCHFFLSHVPEGFAWDQMYASTVKGWRLATCDMAWPLNVLVHS